jgi:RNA-directed DNA polymerase
LREHWPRRREDLLRGTYQPPSAKRVEIPQKGGRVRRLGIPTVRDRCLQQAGLQVLQPCFDPTFAEHSEGCRPGRRAQQASAKAQAYVAAGRRYVVDVDLEKFFDSLDQGLLQEMLQQRVKDGSILRLIGKWLHAGVLEREPVLQPETGSPQGAVMSPMLGNLFLHQVLDDWYMRDVRPRLRGRSFLIRFGDNFILGCEYEADARRILAVLPKRFARFGLTIHPQKTALVPFSKPTAREAEARGRGACEFLGFTHYWTRSRRGYWALQSRSESKARACSDKGK